MAIRRMRGAFAAVAVILAGLPTTALAQANCKNTGHFDAWLADFKKEALANARCMREHGIDFPDPTFGDNGQFKQRIGGNIKPTDPKFQAAMKACGGGLIGGRAAP